MRRLIFLNGLIDKNFFHAETQLIFFAQSRKGAKNFMSRRDAEDYFSRKASETQLIYFAQSRKGFISHRDAEAQRIIFKSSAYCFTTFSVSTSPPSPIILTTYTPG